MTTRTPDELALWMRFLRTPGLSTRRRIELLNAFGSLSALYEAPRALIAKHLGEEGGALTALFAAPEAARIEADLEWFAQPDRHLLTWYDSDYPALLREIADPPAALFVLGQRTLLATPQLAVVGSRNPTAGGRENARAFARHLAQAGLTITSGLALGIDGAAHRGALEAPGQTIAIAGTGLDRVYPPRHRELAHAIAHAGALVSEFPLGMPPRPEHFPIRNRLISGLALGVLVVEAAVRSGSLITARLAGEQGREVFAIPGSIHSPQARGCHALIRQGAKLVETAQDVIEELSALGRYVAAHDPPAAPAGRVPLAAEEKKLLTSLGFDPTPLDVLIARSGLTSQAVSSMLLQLELRGLVAAGPGGTYQRVT
jgi:DNA processing protein